MEYSKQQILEQYERLRAEPDEWADYVVEVEEWAEVGAETLRRSLPETLERP